MARVLEIEKVSKSFQARVLDQISFYLEEGDSVALVGANGAGKSTLIKMILGLLQKDEGELKIFGEDPHLAPQILQRVGYLPEMPGYWGELSAQELLKAVAKLRGLATEATQQRSTSLLSILGLQLRGSRRMAGYSKGMLQRTGVAACLLHDPEFLILDEPMSGLDPRAQEKLRQILLKLREKKKTFLISSHSLEDIRTLCNRVVVLEKGKLVMNGPTSEVLDQLLQKYRSSEPWDEDPLGEIPQEWSL